MPVGNINCAKTSFFVFVFLRLKAQALFWREQQDEHKLQEENNKRTKNLIFLLLLLFSSCANHFWECFY
ncbi:MAG: hypothetical protein A2233_04295 [Candidatus Kerfeldbacteria bacterium RIFOXYA2_FULL_38_24]|uniref:Uncharacterized protein n=1 Tax=Candidatus Kerfeldbacteria bacterium RIFOXYB2_FULL_38_14 TaxID=1798547 RepID=A0A1G2BCI6_9BACT|nr:MAG: hypothetical protein A2233_04295 [Candidatus Kerfeldbacteria bacterium RIFOXYA2_FULL_38_24]OGY86938.1 MAG: hypothetical protein A2319_00140 [Candidatus Kerfeldbacteria bacterium RIFOXYB2_FULL_38_14]OGY89942.1 MAG: hypothetical protein A2458_05150 [Candidatus Kerfeldbacteria bacterium RIFOXYC2_FULL_38_9]